LYYSCTAERCLDWAALSSTGAASQYGRDLWASLPGSLWDVVTLESVQMYVCWMTLQVALERVLPGEVAWGTVIKTTDFDGRAREHRLPYVLSGHLQFWLTLLLLTHGWPVLSAYTSGEGASTAAGLLDQVWFVRRWDALMDLTLIYDHYPGLALVSTAGSVLLSVYLYARSFLPGAVLARGGNTGAAAYDFFIGRELNPRVGGDCRGRGALDLKEFCELRPGLIGWFVINLAMAAAQLRRNGGAGVSGSMICVVLFQGAYVWDALYNERAILSTMDITTDGFGFMLAFGDLTWVPFIYSLQVRFLTYLRACPLTAVVY
jgi:Delta14-sterol reductase